MKAGELLTFCPNLLKALHESGIKTSDYVYVRFYCDYQRLKAAGEKKTYIVAYLQDNYGLSERSVYKLLHKLDMDCPIRAV